MRPLPLRQTLLEWYARHGRRLPWRETRDPYHIWVSEIILQQTRIAQGTDYYLRFVERFPDIASLAAASEDQVLKQWQGLGYYSRARNLYRAAQRLAEQFDGQFPRSYHQIRSLPGIGDYTAAAICSIAYRMPYAVLDGNVYRVLSRYFDLDTPIDTTAGKKLFTRLADEQLDRDRPGDYNQALMDFGALQCTPSLPECPRCPLRPHCRAQAAGTVALRPAKSKRSEPSPRYLHYFHIVSPEGTWVRRRTEDDIWRGLYEFPRIETPDDLPAEQMLSDARYAALIRSASTAEVLETLPPVKHLLSHRVLHIRFYRVSIPTPGFSLEGYAPATEEDLSHLAFPRPLAAYLERSAR